jgi:hypothetical protein
VSRQARSKWTVFAFKDVREGARWGNGDNITRGSMRGSRAPYFTVELPR